MLAPRETVVIAQLHQSRTLTRRDLLILAQECDPELPEVYHDLSYVIEQGEKIVLGGNIMNHGALIDKWLALSSEKSNSTDHPTRGHLTAVDISHPALSNTFQRILKKLLNADTESEVLKQVAFLVYHAAIRSPSGGVGDEPGEDVSTMRKDLAAAFSLSSTTLSSLHNGSGSGSGNETFSGGEDGEISRRRRRDERLDRVLNRADRLTKSVDDGQINALCGHVYACLALSELGNCVSLREEAELYAILSDRRFSGVKTNDASQHIADSVAAMERTCPFLPECEVEWDRYVTGCIRAVSLDSCTVEWFDNACLLAAARLLRKKGFRREANAVSYAFVNFPGSLANDRRADSLGKCLYLEIESAIEETLCTKERNSLVNHAVDMDSSEMSSLADERKCIYVPPTFTCAAEEWKYNKAKLSDEQLAKVSALDKLMGYVGLEDVKQEVLQIYLRYEDMISADTWTGELPNFQLVGNPGTGTVSAVMCYLKYTIPTQLKY
jgi:hypothetical protein